MIIFKVIYKLSVIYGHSKVIYGHSKELVDLIGPNVTKVLDWALGSEL